MRRYEQQGLLRREAQRTHTLSEPDIRYLWRPYQWQPVDLNEVRRRNGLPPVHDQFVTDHRSTPETRAKLSEAMRRSWERRRAEKPLNPQIVTVKDREVEIVPLPDDAVEYTSGGLPIGVTVVRPHAPEEER